MANTNSKNDLIPRLVANDNGYADHKIAWFDSEGRIMTGKVPALIQAGGQGFTTTTGQKVGSYRVGDQEFSCTAAVSTPMNLRNADYPVSVANRVLFTHALDRFGLLGIPVIGSVSLPFRDYFTSNGQRNTALMEKTAQNFMLGDVEVVEGQAQPEVVKVEVFAEALSAFMDWSIDDFGQVTTDYEEMVDNQGEVLVVDIGGSTTDIASLKMLHDEDGGQVVIDHQKSGTCRLGVLDAKAKLEELVHTRLVEEGVQVQSGHSSKLPPNMIETVMQKGKTRYGGQLWDFTMEREVATRTVAEQINNYIKSTVGELIFYQAILIVGGGAVVFRDTISKIIPNSTPMDEFANARGMLKAMRSKAASGEL